MNLTNLYGVTPLHYACYFGNKRAIDLLLNLGADINAKDDEGNTCLHFAINSGCLGTIKKLIIRGVDKSIKRNDNLTAYDLALQNNEFKIAEILKKINFFDKYVCMRTELTPFSYTRNDIVLLLIFTSLVILKLIYAIKLFGEFTSKIINKSYAFMYVEEKNSYDILFNSNSKEDSVMLESHCRIMNADNCAFDIVFEIFILISIILDFSIILSIFYFNCCIRSRRELKIRDKSLIVK